MRYISLSLISQKYQNMKKSKKILFTGKPNAGKTTLIEVFFNGESSKKLLDYFPPSPTYGYDSQVLNLQKKIAVFDLSGQENKRWFTSEDRSIFFNASEIIAVIDATTTKEDILNFTRNVLNLRNEIVPSAIIHILVHKIDLINAKELDEITNFMQEELNMAENLEIHFTSIKKDYFLSTFEIFIKILKEILEGKDLKTEQINFSVLKNTLTLVKLISLKEGATKTELMEAVHFLPRQFRKIIKLLLRKKHLKREKVDNQTRYTLTQMGKKHFQEIIETLSLKQFKALDSNSLSSILPQEKKIPPFAGGLIADKHGKTLYFLEHEDGFLESTLKRIRNKAPKKFDIELIPMFVSALETFSKEINIKSLTGLNLKGNQIRMQVFSYKEFTVTCFFNSEIDVKALSPKIEKHFEGLFRKYEKELKNIIKTNEKEFLHEFRNNEKKWINTINEKYKKYKKNQKYYNFDFINSLYRTIDNLSERTNITNKQTLNQIKKLKTQLLKAAVEENTEELNRIRRYTKKLKNRNAC
ncbi:MAG: ADP-ribosylation factor-like protein, partial [archaeon]